MRNIAVSVAPVWGNTERSDPQKTAEDLIECAGLGAGELHIHVRDRHGKLSADLTVFHEIIRLVRSRTDMVIQVSPGGISPLTMEERCVPLFEKEVEMTSLNMTSMNFGRTVRVIQPEDVDRLLELSGQAGTVAEVEVFDLGDFYTYGQYQARFKLGYPPLFNIGLGHEGRLPATPKALAAFLAFLPPGARWKYTEIGRTDFAMVAAALGMGADGIRVGFEDSPYLEPGVEAKSNAEIVERTVKLIRDMGLRTAAPDEIRSMYGIRG